MPNPYLPYNEYIPDGEPRVFGDRVYIYGSHDRPASDSFCDYRLKVWSASVDDLEHWVCHGTCFQIAADADKESDTDWTDDTNYLYAPDVVQKDGKYYLYAYIMGADGCVAVSDKPEGPFTLISRYRFPESEREKYNGGWFIDPGVLVDDDGKVYVFCGFEASFGVQLREDNMVEVIDDTFVKDIIPQEEPFLYFEACSPRKIGDTYYLIYSTHPGSRLAYATSKKPLGPYEYRGYIVDNGEGYPAGNNHGSICKIGEQWYIFYHRMTNGTIMSRRACVEPIEILEDGSIPQVPMTSLGFSKSLNPYEITPAEIACVLLNGGMVTEINPFVRVVTGITSGCVIGYKYFDFGTDYANGTMRFLAYVRGCGCKGRIHIRIDDADNGEEIGVCTFGTNSGVIEALVKAVQGRHSVFFIVKDSFEGPFIDMFKGRNLLDIESFVFEK